MSDVPSAPPEPVLSGAALVAKEAELERATLLLQATQALAGVGGWEVDLQTQAVFWTDNVYRILETTPEEFKPDVHNTLDFFAPEWQPTIRSAIQQAESTATPHDLEVEMITARGRRIWVHSKSILTLENGQVRKRMSVIQDITRQKEAQAALVASDALFRQVTSQVPGVVYRVHTTAGGRRYYSFVSSGVRELFGVEPEEVLADSNLLVSCLHPDDVETVRKEMSRVAQTGEAVISEYRVVLRDGTVKWVQMTSAMERQDANGMVRTGVMLDVSAQKQSKAALLASEAMLREVTSQVPGLVYRVRINHRGIDGQGRKKFLFVSPGVKQLCGVEPEAVLADGRLLDRLSHPEDRPRVAEAMKTAIENKQPFVSEFRIVLADGSEKWVHISDSEVSRDTEGIVCNGVMIDVTAHKQAEASLRARDDLWKLALESTGDGVWDWYVMTGVGTFSRRMLEMYGFKEGELPTGTDELDRRTHPDDVAQMKQDRQAHFDGLTPSYVNEHRIRCKDGSWKWIVSRGMVISRDAQGRPLRMTGTHTDITDRKNAEALIWRQANFDALTGLPNRRMLRECLVRDIDRTQRAGHPLAVLFIDLDHFKEVNDSLGHDKGDALLVQAAGRIRECLHEADTVARMGGDEFTVVLPVLDDISRLERVVADILNVLSSSFHLGSERAFVSASIGVTLCPDDASEIDALFKQADQALYVAKGAGRNRFSYFTPALQEAALRRSGLAIDLRGALTDGQFWVAYQPIVTLASGAVHKAEALIRWQHPVRGLVSPADFIPIAEATGLILEIGDWVFRQAANQALEWRRTRDPQFQISVNKSPVQFNGPHSSHPRWFDHLQSLGLPGQSVAVEITEGLLLDASPAVNRQLLAFRDAGVSVSLDDFGTGYSSLSYLQQYDIDYLKIDQSFVRNLTPHSRGMALCKAIVLMAHELGMKVIAEGVETTRQRDLLMAAGCDFAQGYLFARPMSAQAFEHYLDTLGSSPTRTA